MVYTVVIYRVNSETMVTYERVKHCWWAGNVFVISQLRSLKEKAHDYWEWPKEQIDHIHIIKE